MWNLEGTCIVVFSGSLKTMVNSPEPVVYEADENVGFMVSCRYLVAGRI